VKIVSSDNKVFTVPKVIASPIAIMGSIVEGIIYLHTHTTPLSSSPLSFSSPSPLYPRLLSIPSPLLSSIPFTTSLFFSFCYVSMWHLCVCKVCIMYCVCTVWCGKCGVWCGKWCVVVDVYLKL
jgi:hypothetical protein